MKKLLLSAITLVACGTASAQVWQTYDDGLDSLAGIRYMDVVDTNTVWAIGYDGNVPARTYVNFTKTSDGVNFTTGAFLPDTLTHVPSNIVGVNDTIAYISAYSKTGTTNGRILQTTDGGLTWNDAADSLMFNGPANFPNVVHFFDAQNGWTMGDPNNTMGWGNEYEIWRTNDGAVTWTRVPAANIPAPTSGEYGLTDVYTTYGSNHIWFGTNKSRVFRSVDGGLTWNVSGVISGMAAGVSGLAFRDSLNGLCWGLTAATNGVFTLRRTIDGGATWTTVAVNQTDVGRFDLCAIPGSYAYMSVGINLGSSAYVTSVTEDDGGTWTVLESDVLPSARMIEVEMVDSLNGWAGNFRDPGLAIGGMNRYVGPKIMSVRPVAELNSDMVYPNPSNGIMNVRIGKAKAGTTISVVDLLGKEVYSSTLNASGLNVEFPLNISGVEKGIYLVKIADGNSLQVSKIIVN